MFGRARHDRLFARFVARGDVHALGEVFDATAPELARIASHLVGDRELARDLVQSAFLIALERRTEFARERRVLPWLCGIIANLARNERRRARRTLPMPPAAERADPHAAAEAAELRAAFARAKAAVPEVYRRVLELHVEQGLNAGEIGSALGRPAGTVRTQIVRALDELRRRLPRDFVAGLVLAPLGAGDLRAARASVLARARDYAGVSGGAAAGGLASSALGAAVMNKKVLLVGSVLVLAALGLWVAWAGFGLFGGEREIAATWVVRTGPSTADGAIAKALRPPAPERAPLNTPADLAGTGRLAVVAIWKTDGTPARRVAVDAIDESDPRGELRPRRVVTGDDGRGVFADLPVGPVWVQTSTGVRRSVEVVADETVTLALELDGTLVTGRVVDAAGAPVADADVWVSSELRYLRSPAGATPGHGQHGQCVLRTDAQGEFTTRLVPSQCIAAFKERHGPSPTVYPLRGSRNPRPVAVVLRLRAGGAALAVSVRGTLGAPVPGALVLAGDEVPLLLSAEGNEATPPARRAFTDGTGTATLAPLPEGRIPIEVRARGHGPWRGEVEMPAAGTVPLAVTLVDGASVAGVVVDGDGNPLAGALVSHGTLTALRSSLARSDAHGAYRLDDLAPGDIELSALHEGWGKVTTTLTTVAAGTQRWDPRMPKRATIRGRAFDEEGRPAAGTYVTAAVPSAASRPRSAAATADAAGIFVLAPLDPGQVYDLRAEIPRRGGGHVVARRTGVPADSEVELYARAEDAPSARLRGRILQRDRTAAAGVLVRATPQDGAPANEVAVGSDGTFALGPWPPARVRLSVHRGTGSVPLADFGVHEMQARTTVDLGDLVLPQPGAARVHLGGGDVERGSISLFRDGAHLTSQLVTELPIEWDDLAPGAYVVSVRARRGGVLLAGATDVRVTAGAVADVVVPIDGARRRQVRFTTPDGQSIGLALLRATDAAGRVVVLDWIVAETDATTEVLVPDATATLRAETPSGWHGEAAVGGAGSGPIEVRLQPGG
ncbi:MAG: sigma-70 family RNA polymerase sigma factor [Planctomycetota bacterium]